MHLRYCLITSMFDCGIETHPKTTMKELGITYQHATPQSMVDQWWFWNCENVPNEIPKFLTPLNLDPMTCIGFGLSQSDAEKIRERAWRQLK